MSAAWCQKELGDPSGRSSSEYWDDWFSSVSYSGSSKDGKCFEWYCGVSEVGRILDCSLLPKLPQNGGNATVTIDDGSNNGCNVAPSCDVSTKFSTNSSAMETASAISRRQCRRETFHVIHPGSGNSNVPTLLRDHYGVGCAFGEGRHCVIDCSVVAIREMIDKQMLEAKAAGKDDNTQGNIKVQPVEYHVGDVLDPPLPHCEAGTFDAWVDKGLLDALFSGNDLRKDTERSEVLFQEAHRILRYPSSPEDQCENYIGGVCIVITLAQEHSLRLLLHVSGVTSTCGPETGSTVVYDHPLWSMPVEVHELRPLDSDASPLRPFAFVLRKDPFTSGSVVSVDRKNDNEEVLVFYDIKGKRRRVFNRTGATFSAIDAAIKESRTEYARAWERRQGMKGSETRLSGDEATGAMHFLAIFEIKPWDCETDVHALAERLKTSFVKKNVKNSHAEAREAGAVFSNLVWRGHKVVPLGFGLCKIVVECIVHSDDVDVLREFITEEEAGSVQSVDIDWERTLPVADVRDILRKQRNVGSGDEPTG